MTLLKISRFFLYLAVVSIGIVLTSTFFPFIGGKYFFFRFMVELAAVFTLLAWGFEDGPGVEARARNLFRQPLFRAVSLFALMFLLASVFAYDSQGAFWSNYERGEGGFQMIHYYLFFALLALLLDRKEEWVTLFKVSIAAGVFMILYGIAAAAGWDGFVGPYGLVPQATTVWARLISEQRFQGSLGNPAYVAPYLLFSIFYVFWLWFDSSRTEKWKHVAYAAVFTLFLLFFILSQTRGAFLGLLAAIFTFFLYLILTRGGRVRKIALGAFISLVVIIGGLFYFRDIPAVKRLPASRLLNLNFQETTAQTRFWTWGSAVRGFKDRPLLGWGPENFSTVFDKYFDPRHYVPGQNTETWFDRAHSVLFDYLAETGFLGLASYLGIFVVYYFEFWRKLWRRREADLTDLPAPKSRFHIHESALLRALLLSIPVAYFVQGLVLFDVLPIMMNWMLVLAFATVVFQEPHHHEHNVTRG